jgi:hypothetical protein
MSFTEDELQSFNTILEQRLNAHQRDMERALDQRMNEYRRELDQRLATVHSDVQRGVSQKLSDFQVRLEIMLSEKLNSQPAQLIKALNREIEQRQQQLEGNIDRMLAAQLLGIEQLITRYSSVNDRGVMVHSADVPTQLDTIEVQTELSWEDLMEIIGRALDDRLSGLNDSIKKSLVSLEQYLSVRLQVLRDDFLHGKTQEQGHHAFYIEDQASIQEILQGVEHLEQIVESMQVVMTSNHALLSNRLYHHQQLSIERAHNRHDDARPLSNDVNQPLTITEERNTNGVEPGGITRQAQMEE